MGCSLTVDGESRQAVMVTSVGEAKEIAVTGLPVCAITLLVVGGGDLVLMEELGPVTWSTAASSGCWHGADCQGGGPG